MDALKTLLWLALLLSAAAMSQESFGRGGHGGGGHGGGGHASCNHGSHSHGSHLGFIPYGYGYGYPPASYYPRSYAPSCADYPELPECNQGNTPAVPPQENNASG